MGSLVGPEGSSLRSAVQSMDCERSGSSGRPWNTGSGAVAIVGGCIISGGATNPPLSRDCSRSSSAVKSVDNDIRLS